MVTALSKKTVVCCCAGIKNTGIGGSPPVTAKVTSKYSPDLDGTFAGNSSSRKYFTTFKDIPNKLIDAAQFC